jgi:hypothetical protein
LDVLQAEKRDLHNIFSEKFKIFLRYVVTYNWQIRRYDDAELFQKHAKKKQQVQEIQILSLLNQKRNTNY